MTSVPVDSAGHSLSDRGFRGSLPVNRLALLEIIDNQWDPHTNPDGYVSLGVAENVYMKVR